MRTPGSVLTPLFDWIAPPSCALCGGRTSGDKAFCAPCDAALPLNVHCCARCGVALAHGALCGTCLRDTPPYARSICLWKYQYPVEALIAAIKYGNDPALARRLGRHLLRELMAERTSPWPQAIVPVPLHPRRLRQRGYNQAVEIARPVARRLNLDLAHRLVTRRRDTPAQVGLTAAQRRVNMRRAFRVSAAVAYRHIALLDDVVTSGATVGALATTLKAAGVKAIEVWSLARA